MTVKLTLLLERVVDGVVEVESPPTDEEMRQLGWVRAPAVCENSVIEVAKLTIPEIPELVVGNGRANGEEKA